MTRAWCLPKRQIIARNPQARITAHRFPSLAHQNYGETGSPRRPLSLQSAWQLCLALLTSSQAPYVAWRPGTLNALPAPAAARSARRAGAGGARGGAAGTATVGPRRADLSDGRQRVLGRVVGAAAVGDAGGGAAGPQDALSALGRGGLQAEEVQHQVEAGRQQAGQRRAAAQRQHHPQQRREGGQQALPVAQHGGSGARRAGPGRSGRDGTGPDRSGAAGAAASPQGEGEGDGNTSAPSAGQPSAASNQSAPAARPPSTNQRAAAVTASQSPPGTAHRQAPRGGVEAARGRGRGRQVLGLRKPFG